MGRRTATRSIGMLTPVRAASGTADQFIDRTGGDGVIQRPGLGVDATGVGAAPVALVPQGLEQRQDEFATALAGQELLGRGDRRLIAMGQGDLQPGEGQFGVAFVRQVQRTLQIGQLGVGQPVGPVAQIDGRQFRKRWRCWVFQSDHGMAEAGPLSLKKATAAASTGSKAWDTGATALDGRPG